MTATQHHPPPLMPVPPVHAFAQQSDGSTTPLSPNSAQTGMSIPSYEEILTLVIATCNKCLVRTAPTGNATVADATAAAPSTGSATPVLPPTSLPPVPSDEDEDGPPPPPPPMPSDPASSSSSAASQPGQPKLLTADSHIFEAGGTSDDVVLIVSQLRTALNYDDLSAVDVFHHPTPAQLAKLIHTRITEEIEQEYKWEEEMEQEEMEDQIQEESMSENLTHNPAVAAAAGNRFMHINVNGTETSRSGLGSVQEEEKGYDRYDTQRNPLSPSIPTRRLGQLAPPAAISTGARYSNSSAAGTLDSPKSSHSEDAPTTPTIEEVSLDAILGTLKLPGHAEQRRASRAISSTPSKRASVASSSRKSQGSIARRPRPVAMTPKKMPPPLPAGHAAVGARGPPPLPSSAASSKPPTSSSSAAGAAASSSKGVANKPKRWKLTKRSIHNHGVNELRLDVKHANRPHNTHHHQKEEVVDVSTLPLAIPEPWYWKFLQLFYMSLMWLTFGTALGAGWYVSDLLPTDIDKYFGSAYLGFMCRTGVFAICTATGLLIMVPVWKWVWDGICGGRLEAKGVGAASASSSIQPSSSLRSLSRDWFLSVYWDVMSTIVTPLLGTSMYTSLLRILGAKIGNGVILYTASVDLAGLHLLTIEDDVIVAHQVSLSTVSVDRYLRTIIGERITLEKDCIIEEQAIIDGGTTLGKRSYVDAVSMVSGGDTGIIPPFTHWTNRTGKVDPSLESASRGSLPIHRRTFMQDVFQLTMLLLIGFISLQPAVFFQWVYYDSVKDATTLEELNEDTHVRTWFFHNDIPILRYSLFPTWIMIWSAWSCISVVVMYRFFAFVAKVVCPLTPTLSRSSDINRSSTAEPSLIGGASGTAMTQNGVTNGVNSIPPSPSHEPILPSPQGSTRHILNGHTNGSSSAYNSSNNINASSSSKLPSYSLSIHSWSFLLHIWLPTMLSDLHPYNRGIIGVCHATHHWLRACGANISADSIVIGPLSTIRIPYWMLHMEQDAMCMNSVALGVWKIECDMQTGRKNLTVGDIVLEKGCLLANNCLIYPAVCIPPFATVSTMSAVKPSCFESAVNEENKQQPQNQQQETTENGLRKLFLGVPASISFYRPDATSTLSSNKTNAAEVNASSSDLLASPSSSSSSITQQPPEYLFPQLLIHLFGLLTIGIWCGIWGVCFVPGLYLLKDLHERMNEQGWDTASTTITLILIIPTIYLIIAPLMLIANIVLKWLILGRYTHNTSHHFRSFWFAVRYTFTHLGGDRSPVLMSFVAPYLGGTRWLIYYYRAMGMTIGDNVYVGAFDVFGDYDLHTVGEWGIYSGSCDPFAHTVQAGKMRFGQMKYHSQVTLASRAHIMAGCTIGQGTKIESQTVVTKGDTVPAGIRYAGTPGKKAGKAKQRVRFVTSGSSATATTSTTVVPVEPEQISIEIQAVPASSPSAARPISPTNSRPPRAGRAVLVTTSPNVIAQSASPSAVIASPTVTSVPSSSSSDDTTSKFVHRFLNPIYPGGITKDDNHYQYDYSKHTSSPPSSPPQQQPHTPSSNSGTRERTLQPSTRPNAISMQVEQQQQPQQRLPPPLPPSVRPTLLAVPGQPQATSSPISPRGVALRARGTSKQQRRPTVCVIGAGASGLTTALELHFAGIDVSVLEKSPSVGGKSSSFHYQNQTYDLGAHNMSSTYENIEHYATLLKVPRSLANAVVSVYQNDPSKRIKSDTLAQSSHKLSSIERRMNVQKIAVLLKQVYEECDRLGWKELMKAGVGENVGSESSGSTTSSNTASNAISSIFSSPLMCDYPTSLRAHLTSAASSSPAPPSRLLTNLQDIAKLMPQSDIECLYAGCGYGFTTLPTTGGAANKFGSPSPPAAASTKDDHWILPSFYFLRGMYYLGLHKTSLASATAPPPTTSTKVSIAADNTSNTSNSSTSTPQIVAWKFDHGMQSLWDSMVDQLNSGGVGRQRVFCNVEIQSITRSADGVIVTYRDPLIENRPVIRQFDSIVFSISPLATLPSLDVTQQERTLFEKIRYLPYVTIVARLTTKSGCGGLGKGGGGLFLPLSSPSSSTSARIGHIASIQHQGSCDNNNENEGEIYTFSMYRHTTSTTTSLKAKDLALKSLHDALRTDLDALGCTLLEILHTADFSEYMPHASTTSLTQGFSSSLTMLQGQRRTYWTGALFSFESLEAVMEYSKRLVEKKILPELLTLTGYTPTGVTSAVVASPPPPPRRRTVSRYGRSSRSSIARFSMGEFASGGIAALHQQSPHQQQQQQQPHNRNQSQASFGRPSVSPPRSANGSLANSNFSPTGSPNSPGGGANGKTLQQYPSFPGTKLPTSSSFPSAIINATTNNAQQQQQLTAEQVQTRYLTQLESPTTGEQAEGPWCMYRSPVTGHYPSMLDLIYYHVVRQPNMHCMSWVNEKGVDEMTLTYAQFWKAAMRVAEQIRKKLEKMKTADSIGTVTQFPPQVDIPPLQASRPRVLLCYTFDLNFITGFIGCLLADVIAVPIYPPDPSSIKRSLTKLNAIRESCDARLALTNTTFNRYRLLSSMTQLGSSSTKEGKLMQWPKDLEWIVTDATPGVIQKWKQPLEWKFETTPGYTTAHPSKILFLQYTSGSTGLPKGVCIGHQNVLHNIYNIYADAVLSHKGERMIFSGWLPPFHDFGLIAQHLTQLVSGGSGYFMSPLTFISRPMIWPQTLSRVRCTMTGSPNFGLELVTRKYQAPDASKGHAPIDLSCVKNMMMGAEPCRISTVQSFLNIFAVKHAFSPKACVMGYGLAEHVFCAIHQFPPVSVENDFKYHTSPLHPTVLSMGSHFAIGQVDLRIVNADTCVECPLGEIGEIWMTSPSKAVAYWNMPEVSVQTFHSVLNEKGGKSSGNNNNNNLMVPLSNSSAPRRQNGVDSGDIQLVPIGSSSSSSSSSSSASRRTYLRTGDEGYILHGQLYLTGRIKDLIIVRGEKYYPHDIEATVVDAHQHVRPGNVAAFADVAGNSAGNAGTGEQLIIVAELRAPCSNQSEYNTIAQAICSDVRSAHGVAVSRLVLLPPKTIAKTSSGKIARSESRTRLAQNSYKVLYEMKGE